MPKILQTQKSHPESDVRIVATSSNAAFAPFLPKGGLALSEMHKPDAYGPMTLYTHSKLANVHFVRKVSQMYPQISVTAVHPRTVKSDIWGKSGGGLINTFFKAVVWAIAINIDQGAKPQLWCATAPLSGPAGIKSGQFYENVGKLKTLEGIGADQKLTDELWAWTNQELASHGYGKWPAA